MSQVLIRVNRFLCSAKLQFSPFDVFCFMYCLLYSWHFLRHQACEDVIRGFFPTAPEKLIHLAALRTQFVRGDYVQNDWMYDICSFANLFKNPYKTTLTLSVMK